jgi:parallel beta-helix repeat protein
MVSKIYKFILFIFFILFDFAFLNIEAIENQCVESIESTGSGENEQQKLLSLYNSSLRNELGKKCDFTQVIGLIGLVKKQIKLLQDITCDKFEQTWTILGEIDQDIFDTRTILCAKFEGTFTTLNNIEQEIIDTRTILCDKFEQTWTILGEIDQDIFDTRTILCDKFEQTWTILGEIDQDIFDTRTILCAKFEGTFTALDTIEEEVVDTRTILCDKLIQILNTLPSLEGCDTNVIQISSAPFVISSPGAYCLTQNLMINISTNAITNNSNDVALDLNNYQIVGDNLGIGILIDGPRENITIKNGTVRNLNTGILITALGQSFSSKITLENILATNNTQNGFLLQNIENTKIENCRACRNIFNGISILGASRCTLKSCIANNNNQSGFVLNNTRCIKLTGCSLYNNQSNGVLFLNSEESLIHSCVANSNECGFELTNCQAIVVRKCEAKNNIAAGFFLNDPTTNCYLLRNVAISNGTNGFRQDIDPTRIYRNYALNNAGGDYLGIDPVLVTNPTDVLSLCIWDYIPNITGI